MFKHIIRNFDKAAATFDAAAFLFAEINQKMIQRLEVIPIKPNRILDCGCGTGISSQTLLKNFKKAEVFSFDLSSKMLYQAKKKKTWRQSNYFVRGNAIQLPFATNSFDFVYANLMLHWCNNIHTIFSEWQRVLKPNGLLMFTAFGPDTCKELLQAIHNINMAQQAQGFIDMHNLGDALIKNQLLDPVLDVENFQLNYSNVEKLITELRQVGGRNLHPARCKKLFGKGYLQQLQVQLNKFKTADNKIPLSVEVIYGHAWAGITKVNIQNDTEVAIPLFSIKKSKK